MVSEGNAPGLGGGQSSPKRCARTQTSGPVERIPLAPTVGSDLRERRSAQRLPHSADKDEAGGSSPPRPTAGPDQRKRWLIPARARGRSIQILRSRGSDAAGQHIGAATGVRNDRGGRPKTVEDHDRRSCHGRPLPGVSHASSPVLNTAQFLAGMPGTDLARRVTDQQPRSGQIGHTYPFETSH
jgi:hypothetical protein